MGVHVIAALTDPRLRGAGLAVSMFAKCLAEAIKKGYKGQVSEATGFQSQKLLKHYATLLGPDMYSETHISYHEWEFEGKHVFSGLAVPSLVLSVQMYPERGTLIEEVLLCMFYCGTVTAKIRSLETSAQLEIYAHLQAATAGTPDPNSCPPL